MAVFRRGDPAMVDADYLAWIGEQKLRRRVIVNALTKLKTGDTLTRTDLIAIVESLIEALGE